MTAHKQNDVTSPKMAQEDKDNTKLDGHVTQTRVITFFINTSGPQAALFLFWTREKYKLGTGSQYTHKADMESNKGRGQYRLTCKTDPICNEFKSQQVEK